MVQKVAFPFPAWFATVKMANSTARRHSLAAPARAAHREYLAMLPAASRACALFPRAVVEPKPAFPYPVTCARVTLAGSHAIRADRASGGHGGNKFYDLPPGWWCGWYRWYVHGRAGGWYASGCENDWRRNRPQLRGRYGWHAALLLTTGTVSVRRAGTSAADSWTSATRRRQTVFDD